MKSIDSLNFGNNSANGDALRHPLFAELKDHIGVLSSEEAAAISSYMEVFRDKEIVWMSYPSDPLDPNKKVEKNGGNDGKFKWSGITHYLIEQHRVDPPMEFRSHVNAQLASSVDLQKLAAKLIVSDLRRSPAMIRERKWRRKLADGGIKEAYALYP